MSTESRGWSRLRSSSSARVGAVIVGCLVMLALVGPWIARHEPNVPNFDDGRGPFGTPRGPSAQYWLGTDTLFRDIFARISQGGRLSLEVAFAGTALATIIGTTTGVVAGFFRGVRVRIDGVLELAGALCVVGAIGGTLTGSSDTGWRLLAAAIEVAILAIIARLSSVGLAIVRADNRIVFTSLATDLLLGGLVVGSIALRHGLHIGDHRRALVATSILFVVGVARRIAERRQQSDGVWLRVDVDDLLMRAVDVLLSFPFLLLLMALAAAIDRTSQTTICLVLGLTSWAGVARVVRSKTLQVARRDYVVAARALGQRAVVIAVRHVMPNVAGTVIVLATGLVGSMIVAEAALAFLGLSVPPPAASWGRMLDEGRPYVSDAPWVLGAPAAAILLSVLGFNLLGEGLRDAFDPRDSRG